MDPTDYNFDEDEIREREMLHTELTIYIRSIVLIMTFYICFHVVSSALSTQFQALNPICLLLAIELGLRCMKYFSPRLRRYLAEDFFLATLMMTITAVSFLLQLFLVNGMTDDFALQILQSAFGSFVVINILCLILIIVSSSMRFHHETLIEF